MLNLILTVTLTSFVSIITFSVIGLCDIASATLTNQTNQTTPSSTFGLTNTVNATEITDVTNTETSGEEGPTTTTAIINTTSTTKITRPIGTDTNRTTPTEQVTEPGTDNNTIVSTETSSEDEVPTNAVIYITSSLSSKCRPVNECSGVRAGELLRNQIITNQTNINASLSVVKPSEVNQPILVPIAENKTIEYAIKQLDIQENSVFKPRYNISTTYSTECRGMIKAGETKECIILSILEDRDSPKGGLQINTTIANDCLPSQFNYCGICLSRNICTNVRADDLFSDHISTLNQNIHREELSIPASEKGWTIEVFPDHSPGIVQYDIKQRINDIEHILSARSLNVTYSPGCHGRLPFDGELKICEIVNHTLLP